MTSILLDTGPLVAFLKRDDTHHAWALAAFAAARPPLRTCEPVLAEASYLLRSFRGGPEKVLELVERGTAVIDFRLQDEAPAIRALIAKYGSQVMDLADACLVRMAERRPASRVLTVDSQFRDIYRRNGRQMIPTILPSKTAKR